MVNTMTDDAKQALRAIYVGSLLIVLMVVLMALLTMGPPPEHRIKDLIKSWEKIGTHVSLVENMSLPNNNFDASRASLIFKVIQDKPPYMERMWVNPATSKSEEVRITYVAIVMDSDCNSCWEINFYKDLETYVSDAKFDDYLYLIKYGNTFQAKTKMSVKKMLSR